MSRINDIADAFAIPTHNRPRGHFECHKYRTIDNRSLSDIGGSRWIALDEKLAERVSDLYSIFSWRIKRIEFGSEIYPQSYPRFSLDSTGTKLNAITLRYPSAIGQFAAVGRRFDSVTVCL